MTDRPQFPDNYDGKHTYSEEERKLIIDEISKRLFDERRFFALLIFDAERPPSLLVNGGERTTKHAFAWVTERLDDYFDPKNEVEIFAEYGRRQ